MRVTLVHPAGFNFVPGQPDFSVLANRMPPIGIMQLASWLEKFGHSVQLHDCLGPYAPPGIAENAEIVLATDPEMVGFSATTSGFMDAVDMALYIKEKRPEIKIVFGNVHVSSIGAPILEHFPEIDYLVIGEGEGRDARSGRRQAAGRHRQPDLARRSGRIVINPRRDRILNLDELPFPAYEKLAGFPARLSPAAVRLREAPRRDDDHLARLPLHLLVLRPHRVRAAVQDQLGAVHLRPHEVPARQVRRVSHQLVRRPVHRQEAARHRPVRTADREAARHAVQLRHPHRPHLGRNAGQAEAGRAR